MAFFEKVKRKIRKNHLISILLALLFGSGSITAAVFNGFSNEVEWRIAFIPAPNWLVSGILILIGLFAAFHFFKSIIAVVKLPGYHALMETAEKLGNVAAIGERLDAIEQSPFVKEMLKVDDMYFFYLNDTDPILIPTSRIRSIQPVQESGRGRSFHVTVLYDDQCVNINTADKNLEPLTAALFTAVKQSRSQPGA